MFKFTTIGQDDTITFADTCKIPWDALCFKPNIVVHETDKTGN